MLKIVFMCPGTLSLSTPVDADGSDPSQCCFLLCCFRVVAFLLFFFQSFILKCRLNLLAGQYCFCSCFKKITKTI